MTATLWVLLGPGEFPQSFIVIGGPYYVEGGPEREARCIARLNRASYWEQWPSPDFLVYRWEIDVADADCLWTEYEAEQDSYERACIILKYTPRDPGVVIARRGSIYRQPGVYRWHSGHAESS